MWIELLGFDLDQQDFGVEALCTRAGFIPQVVTLLLSDPEFVHGHTGKLDRAFSKEICSYGGHPYNEDRKRQPWTARDLLGLVRALHRKGVSVYFTHFDAPLDGWLNKHPELRALDRHGKWTNFMSPYKRLADGRPYRDFYLPLLKRVITDFEFDGYHAGDGFAHPRLPIYDGDFSDDTVSQYSDWSGDPLPKRFTTPADHKPAAIRQRAAWLWKERRLSWIRFQQARTTDFWSSIIHSLRGQDAKVIFNTCWTRDPFEALYRYGVDYAALDRAGMHAFLAETSAAVQEYGGDLPYGEPTSEAWEPRGTLARFSTHLQLLRADLPKAKIIFMNGIKDTNEAWNGIRHAPTNVESEILSHVSRLSLAGSGKLKPAADGMLCVLSDGLAESEWKWIRDRWDLAYSLRASAVTGVGVYWADDFVEKLTVDYVSARHVPVPEIISQLTLAGASIGVTVRPEQLAEWKGPLVVIHPHLLNSNEWQQLEKRKEAPLITIGGAAPATKLRGIHLHHGSGPNGFHTSIFHWSGSRPKATAFPRPTAFDPATAVDPIRWLVPLPAKEIPEAVYQHLAEWINLASGEVKVLFNPKDIRAWSYTLKPRTLRVYVRNESFYYRICHLELPGPCRQVKTLTAFPGNPVTPDGPRLAFKMAGKSMAIFDVVVAD